MGSVVDLRSAVVLLGRFPALAGIDIAVGGGEIVHLRGSNGAGKTTLLRACAGLHRIDGGSAHVIGVDLSANRREVRRNVGLLAHEGFLYDDLTVADNLAFWTRATRSNPADAEASLESVGLEKRLRGVTVRSLSAGQRRRASLAAMILRRPRLWLLDEPHAGLDAAGRDMVDSLVTTASHSGATVLFASHELDRARSIRTREVQIDGGVVVADSSDGR